MIRWCIFCYKNTRYLKVTHRDILQNLEQREDGLNEEFSRLSTQYTSVAQARKAVVDNLLANLTRAKV